jgi:phthalate 4,5-cis-dihydrodiol dehydrogenase
VTEFGGRIHHDLAALCADQDVDAVYIATPHAAHAAQAIAAAAAGKHVLVEKPMTLSLADGQAMVAAAEHAGTVLMVGHSHSFDTPVQRARALIGTPGIGRLRMITAIDFTDFMFRPRRPDELTAAGGGGVIFNQAAHQIDIVRFLGGGMLATVRAEAGIWDRSRPVPGAYTALLTFADGTAASLTYSGYAHFDSDELMEWIGESGHARRPEPGKARRELEQALVRGDELAFKEARAYGGADTAQDPLDPPVGYEHFGFLLASCEHADIRPLPTALMVYGDYEVRREPLPPPVVPRQEVVDELVGAVLHGARPVHDGRFGLATLEACMALERSAREHREIALELQLPTER